jgi:WD40 repeat protein
MSYNYVTYYALSDGQRRVAWFCFCFGLASVVLGGLVLLVMANLIARPTGIEPSWWGWTPADVYSLVCFGMFTLLLVGGACFFFSLRQYWVDWKVSRRSEGITGLYNLLSFVTFVVGAVGVVFLLRFLYFSGYVLPVNGWPEGAIWATTTDSEVTQVAFSDDGRLFYVRTSTSSGSRNYGSSSYGKSSGVSSGSVQAYTYPGGLPRPGTSVSNIGPQSRRVEPGMPLSLSTGTYTVQQTSTAITGLVGAERVVGEGLVLTDQNGNQRVVLPHADRVRCVAVSTDGQRLVTGDNAGVIRVWDIERSDPLTLTLRPGDGSSRAVLCLALSPDGLFAAGASEDGTVRVWDLSASLERRTLKGGRTIRQIALCTGAFRLVTIQSGSTGSGEELVLWDVSLGKEIKKLKLQEYGSSSQESKLALSPDGHYALVATGSRTVQLWRLPEK